MGIQCLLLCGNDTLPGILRNAGPARLATELRKEGFTTICADIGPINNPSWYHTIEKIINKFVDKDTLWVGISTTFLNSLFGVPFNRTSNMDENLVTNDDFLLHFIDICKQKNSNIKFIIGGSYFINLSKYGFYHFRGYADHELIEFTKWCKFSSYKMIGVNRIGKIIDCGEYKNFVTSKISWHETDFILPNETLPIEISRGCIFKCKFCAFPLNGKDKGEWIKHCDILTEELMYNYERYGVTKYIFADDTYNDSAYKITELYERVFSKLPFNLQFTSYLRLDLMYRFKDTIEILEKSGLRSAMLGIETNNIESAKSIGKGMPWENQIDFVRELKQNQLKNTLFQSAFIIGLPKDTKESINELSNFLISTNNPLDEWIVRPLAINPIDQSLHKKYFSEFDINYEKYGYNIIGRENNLDIYKMKWTLSNTDIDYDYCLEKSSEINKVSDGLPNMKFGAQTFARISTVIPEDEVFIKSKSEIRRKYDVKSLISGHIRQYYDRLLSY